MVKSRAGDAAGPLQTSFRRVKYLRVEDPTPTGPDITGLNSDGQAEGVVKLDGANLNIRGTGFADGGVVTIKDSNDDNMVMALEASWDPVTQQLQLYIDTEATPAAGPGTVIVATIEGEATHACTFAS